MTTTEFTSPVETNSLPALDHREQPREGEQEFFAPPPPEIGAVRSAESTLKVGKNPNSLVMRLFIAAVLVVGIVGGMYWGTTDSRKGDREALMLLAWILAAIAVAIHLFVSRFKATCTYVGDAGAARYQLRRSRNAEPRVELLRFADAAAVYTSQTRQFVNGVYTGTTYDYSWNAPDGRRIFRLKGQHRGKNGPPKAGDPYHFANAAENSWSRHYLARAQAELKERGFISFPVDRKRIVRVGPGFLEFDFSADPPTRVTKEEIASVSLSGGQFSFKHKDAKWFSSAGKFRFAYGNMANAKVFLIALETLMGYSWG